MEGAISCAKVVRTALNAPAKTPIGGGARAAKDMQSGGWSWVANDWNASTFASFTDAALATSSAT